MSKAKKLNAFKQGSSQKSLQNAKNPFDLKVNNIKFNILNRNLAGSTGRPTQSKARSLVKRTSTMLPELLRRGRTGNFVDRRFGERNSTLSAEDKMLARFSHERMRSSKKKAVFNLENYDESKDSGDYSHTLKLTHRGKSVDEAFDSDPDEAFDDHLFSEEDHDQIASISSGSTKKSHSEIMQEIIAKSKKHKLDRQKLKEENAALCDDLDADFRSILARGGFQTRQNYHGKKDDFMIKEGGDDYSETVREMTFEKRGQPTDRTKTVKELQDELEEKQRTDALEKEKRMILAEDDDNDVQDDIAHQSNRFYPKNRVAEFDNEDAEQSIKKVMDRVRILVTEIMEASSLEIANVAYKEMVALSQTNSIIPVARVIRELFSNIHLRSIKSRLERGPTMPPRSTLLLLHIVGLIFSTSDYHHIVVTPAILLIFAYLEHGRILNVSHLVSALFLIQTIFLYTMDSKRLCPEAFALLYPLLRLALGVQIVDWSQYPADRFMSKRIHDFLAEPLAEQETIEPRPITFNDLFLDDNNASKKTVISFLLHLIKTAVNQYKECVAAPEILSPFIRLIGQSGLIFPQFIADLETVINNVIINRKPPKMLKQKAIPIPSLTPDIDYGPTREEKARRHLQLAYKRELKGAKRELRRDSAFLAHQKLKMRLDADHKYQERHRQIIGSISNESPAPKKGRK